MTFTPGQPLIWYRPRGKGGGKMGALDRVKTPATFVRSAPSRKTLLIRVKTATGFDDERWVKPEWVEPACAGGAA